MFKRRRAFFLGLAIAGAGVTATYFWKSEPVPVDSGLVLYGNIDIRQVNLAFNVAGPIARMLVEEGDQVQPGQLLGELEDAPYKFDVGEAAARLKGAQARVAKLEAGSRPAEKAQARARVEEALASLRNAETTFERRQQLVDRGDASRQAYDDARQAVGVTTARVDSARQELSLVLEGPRQEDIDAARADQEAAQAALENVRYRLSRTRLVAPSGGFILTRVQEPGAVVQPHTPVYTLSITDPVWARTYVSETDLGRIFPGMRGLATSDSNPGKAYQGWIGFISPTAEFTPKTVETPDLRTNLVYRLRLYIDDPDQGLRQGMPVTIRLLPDQPARQ